MKKATKKIVKMTEAEIKTLLDFLEDLSNEYGNAGCNDFTLLNTPENLEMVISAIKYGYRDDDQKEVLENILSKDKKTIRTVDFVVLDYLTN